MIIWKGFFGFFTTGLPNEVLYPLLFGALFSIVVGMLSNIVKNKVRFTLWVFLILYLIVLFCSTVICREETSFEFDRLELIPFWTYSAVINQLPGVSVWDIVLNIALFVPFGFLLKLLFCELNFYKIIVIGVICSICIETSQYVFEKGLSQFDDVMHNTIGACIGWLISKGILLLMNKLNAITDK